MVMNRVFAIAFLGLVGLFAAGCDKGESKASWENIKIGDIGPVQSGKGLGGQLLKAATFDLYIYEVPGENVGKLEDLWQSLYARGLGFYNYRAFSANLFRVGFGKRFRWSGTQDFLRAAGGKRMAKIALLLADGELQKVTVTGLDRPQELSYIAIDLSREKANVGPGIMALRVSGERLAGERGVCQVIGYPVFWVPATSAIAPLAEQANQREVKFTAAGFGLKMSPDDFVVLGPRKYLSERVTLSGLFFSNLEGTMFLSKGKAPELKPSVRVFVLVCTGISY
jgi:hypothetical protein